MGETKKFAKDVFILSAGTGLAQGISILLSPILTRIYTPSEFGLYTLFISIVGISSVVGAGRLELALLLPKSKKETLEILALAFRIIGITTLASLLITSIWFGFNYKISDPVYWFIPIGSMLVSSGSILNYLAIRHAKFKQISYAQMGQSIANNFVSIVFGFFEVYWGLIFGYLVGLLAYILGFRPNRSSFFLLKFKGSSLHKTLFKYRDFPTINSLSALSNLGSNQLPVLVMAYYFNDATIGLYGLIMRILNLPLNLIGKSVSQVLFHQLSRNQKSKSQNQKYIYKVSVILFIIIGLGLTPLFFWGEEIFTIAFGTNWAEGGRITKYFIPFFILRFVYFGISSVLIIKRKLKLELFQNMSALILQVFALITGCIILKDSDTTFALIGLAGFISYSIFLVQLFKVNLKTESL